MFDFIHIMKMKTRLLPFIALAVSALPLLAAELFDPAKYEAPIKVACVGDSITQGAGAAKGKSYPTQLQEMLGDEWKVMNYGLGGRTLMDRGNRPYMKEKAYQEALASAPDVVIIMLGTNDTKPQNWEKKMVSRLITRSS